MENVSTKESGPGLIRIADLSEESIVDGPGLRYVIYTQGCPHNCKGCHNPITHDPQGGKLVRVSDIVEQLKTNPLLAGITISGGEPFNQVSECIELAKQVKNLGMDVVIYTGYTLKQLTNKTNSSNRITELISLADILIDGRFIEEQKDLTLKFRGSKNQTIIENPITKMGI